MGYMWCGLEKSRGAHNVGTDNFLKPRTCFSLQPFELRSSEIKSRVQSPFAELVSEWG